MRAATLVFLHRRAACVGTRAYARATRSAAQRAARQARMMQTGLPRAA
ncbi:hypothetical protein BURMUCGD1_4327 [Burkholderia multivorans CGD1]|nr:hypothetical protein BURMUCGD1_4327 [Burkholderia multivorans CGD1]